MALVQRTGLTRLAQIQAVQPGYPFYGEIITKPAGEWAHLQDGRVALVDPSLLIALDAHIGDTLALGFARFIIAGTLVSVPGDVGVSTTIGPRIYIPASLSRRDVAADVRQPVRPQDADQAHRRR